MLDPWIIEDLLRREEEQRHERDRGRVEVPLAPPFEERNVPAPKRDKEGDRGVTIIDL